MAGLAAARMSGGSEFHAAGPACEKARSLNLICSRGVTYLLLEADRRTVRIAALLDVQRMSARYAGICQPNYDYNNHHVSSHGGPRVA